jgi:murein DD-endopeptidase MepM/ murein hydrolase activator NlpD
LNRKLRGTSTISRRFKAVTARVAPLAAAAGAALILWHAARDKPAVEGDPPAPLVYPGAGRVAVARPQNPIPNSAGAVPAGGASDRTAPAIQQASVASTLEVVVARNDTMDAIFRRMALDTSDLAAIRNLPGIRQRLDFLKPGDVIEVTHTDDGEIRQLSRKVNETQTLQVVRQDSGFAATMIDDPVETRVRTGGASIESSLFQAAESSDISDVVALKLANVFAYDIDFVLDIREGDHFTVEYEQIYQDGRYLRDGEVLAAEFVNGGKTYRAICFTTDAGVTGYYSPDGRPLRKAFLRAPVDFTRVSSVFALNRMHPILNLIRGHMGTDYAAPTGTPVYAAGEGHVSFEGTRGGYGNAIVLFHGNNVSTLYGHMSRFARNVHLGSHVNQGEVIGYVGMTGLATGPHLHYEYLKNGVHMNPQTVPLPGAEPLRGVELGEFMRAAGPLLSALAAPPRPSPAVTASVAAASTQPLGDSPSKTSLN